MKVCFSLSSSNSKLGRKPNLKPKVSRKPNVKPKAPALEYITEFDASKTLATTPTKRIIIPPKENEWKNLDLPLQSSTEATNIRFELGSSDAAAADSKYGLNIRNNSKSQTASNHPDELVDAPLSKKLKLELARLPDEQGLGDFAEVPVEGFGAALLAGYGWTGRGIGRNKEVKIVQRIRKESFKLARI